MFTLSLFIFLYHQNLFRCTENSLSSRDGTPSVGPLSYPDKCLFLYLFLKTFIFQIYQHYRPLLTYHSFLPQRRNNFSVLLFVAFGSVYYLYLVFFFPVRHVVFFPGAETPLSGPLWCRNLNIFFFSVLYLPLITFFLGYK